YDIRGEGQEPDPVSPEILGSDPRGPVFITGPFSCPGQESPMGTAPELIIVTGPVGAGKTTIAFATATLLEDAGIPHAVVGMDALRDVYPAPEADPSATRIGYDNLAAVWTNLRTDDPRVVMLADVVEQRDQVAEYERAVPGARVPVVRL